MKALPWVVGLVGLAVPLVALSTATGPLGLDAGALGAAGAVVATAKGTTALDWNPAGLVSPGWDVSYDLGQGGPADSLQQGLAAAGALDPTLGVGVRVGDQAFGSYQEGVAGLGAAVRMGRWVSLGMVQKLLVAEPGGLRGWSMDLGAGVSVPLGAVWRLRLGAAASDLASSLAWADGLEEVQPTATRLGLALQAAPGTWLALEQDHLDRQGNGGVDQWRAGAQLSLWGRRLALRAGATEAAGASLYATAGLGLRLPWAGRSAALDYAVLVPAPVTGADVWRQLFSLNWRFGQPLPPVRVRARLAQTLVDRQGRLHLARIALSGAPADVRVWQVAVKDKRGRTVKVFSGKGPVPAGLVWDGRDTLGQPVAADGLSYELRGSASDGASFQRRALLAPAPQGGLGGALAGVGSPTWGLRTEAPAAAPGQPQVKLKGGNDLAISSADFDVAAVAGPDTKGWELRIVDSAGKTVKTIQGRGRPPKDVRWEGNDDLGQPLRGSLGASYEIRVTDADGRQRVAAAAPVVASADFAALAARAQARAVAPTCGCRRDAGGLHCVLYFARRASWLSAQAQATLDRALDRAGRLDLHAVRVRGYARPGAEALRLAQARADEVLRRLVDRGRMALSHATVDGRVQAGRPGRVDLDVGLAP